MPGELANCIAGRIANIFNFHGPNYVVDAACASAMAAISSAVEGLVANDFDVAVTGGIDRNMGASTFVKFCKIGALSATGTRPYAEGADGFVMGEGAAIFLLKRLADAERDGDKIYAVLRGMGGSSDGKGKGITAPNPIGQKLAIERAWQNAGLSPATATLIEGHGTSTRVGDVVEVQSMVDVLSSSQSPPALRGAGLGQIELRASQRSGRRCRTAESHPGASGQSTAAQRALRASQSGHRLCPLPALRQYRTETVDDAGRWRAARRSERFWFWRHQFPRCARRIHSRQAERKRQAVGGGQRDTVDSERASPMMHVADVSRTSDSPPYKAPLRGALVIGAASEAALVERLRAVEKDAKAGRAPAPTAPAESDLRAPERLAIDYANAAELADKSGNALKALAANQPAVWKALRAQGIFRGHGPAPKVAFLYTGQGSQYVNMLQPLRATEPIVAETFAEADRIMTPLARQAAQRIHLR